MLSECQVEDSYAACDIMTKSTTPKSPTPKFSTLVRAVLRRGGIFFEKEDGHPYYAICPGPECSFSVKGLES